MNVSTRYAIRSLRRSTTRTLLSLFGIAVGVAIGVIATAWIRGEGEMFVKAAASSGTGHLQLTPNDWQRTRDERLRIEGDFREALARIRALPQVKAAAVHVMAEGLLGMGTRVQSAQLRGVDPLIEPSLLRYVKNVEAGRYLKADDKNVVVLGVELARRLDSEVGDELVVTSVAPGGDLNSALLTIVGTVRTGSRSIDSALAHINWPDAVVLSGRKGVSNITVNLIDSELIDEVKPELVKIAGDSSRVLTWMEVSPALVSGMQADAAFSKALIFVVILLVLLGVTSAQLTSVLQREREFSVLSALGMGQKPLVRLVLVEAFVLGSAGSVLGLLLSTPLVYYLATVGVDFADMVGEEGMSMGGVLMDPVMRASFGYWIVPYALGLGLVATLGGAIYPAWFTRKIDPAEALRGRG